MVNVPAEVAKVLPSSAGQSTLAPAEPVDVGDATEVDEAPIGTVADEDAVAEDVMAAADEATALRVVVI
jgi:hypothetical protein